MTGNHCIGSVCLLMGISFILIYYFIKKKFNKLLANGIPTEGVIFDFETSYFSFSGSESKDISKPIIRFLTLKQEWITETYKVGFTVSTWKAGDHVRVWYNPENPKEFVVATRLDKWIFSVFLMVGILLILSSVGLFIISK
jgi:hypothetical protein